MMLKRVLQKTSFALGAFGSGIVWGIAAEANAAGIPLLAVFQG
jgi:hypothetical protein